MKQIVLVLAILIMVFFCGCTHSPPKSASEEIVLYSWKLKGENDNNNTESTGYLNFDNDKINLTIKKGDKSELKMNEYYEIDNESIVIVSEKYGNIILKYRLKGNELELAFDDSYLYFVKQ